MKCQHCGAKTVVGAAFCQSCGRQLSSNSPQPTVKQRIVKPSARGPNDEDREIVLWEGRYSKRAMLGSWFAAGVLTLAGLIAGAIANVSPKGWTIIVAAIVVMWAYFVLRLFYLKTTVRYTLTNQRFIHERGLLWRQIDRIETIDVDDVSIRQGPIDRLMGVGAIRLVSSDQSSPQFLIVGIEDVREVATLIDNARREERKKRAVHIESM